VRYVESVIGLALPAPNDLLGLIEIDSHRASPLETNATHPNL
jgi:hypothetical protein